MIIDIKNRYLSTDIILIECDFKTSIKCKGQYYKLYKNIIRCRSNNNGKDRCIFCFNSSTKAGSNNFNFKFEKNENYFEKIDSEIKAYLLGWIAGDGHIKKDGLHLEIHKSDVEILELFRLNISPDSKIIPHKTDSTILLKIFSVKMVKDILTALKLKNPGKKAYKIVLPDLDDELMWHFIRGLIDSDGHVTSPYKKTSPCIKYCSMSVEIKNQIINFCNRFCIFTSKKEPCISWYGNQCINLIHKLYENAFFFLNRKRDFAIIYKTWIYRKGNAVNKVKARKARLSGYNYTPSINQLEKLRLLNMSKRKLSNDDILNIKLLLENGISQLKIAKQYNVSQTTICKINKNLIYKNKEIFDE